MTRPKPRVLLESIDNDMRAYQVCDADAIYAVCYKGRPIKVKTYTDIESNYPGPKYVKTSFPSSGHAFNLADKLNKKFDTTDFTVVIMTTGRIVSEH